MSDFLKRYGASAEYFTTQPANVMKQGGKIDDDCADNDTKAGFITLFFAYLVGCLGCGVGKMFISLVYFLLKICGYIGLLN